MHLPEPALILWIVGAPFVLAIVDLFRTRTALRSSHGAASGAWSQALHIDQAKVVAAVA
jgi:hypothetical protein